MLVKDRVKKPKPAQYAKVMREVFDRATAPVATPAERLGFGFASAAALAVGWATLASTGASLL